MGVYDFQIDGAKVKATLLDPNFSLETAISEFKSHIEPNLPVVGVDFKPFKPGTLYLALLLLYTKDRCLIIQLSLNYFRFPKPLGLFLSDKSICFVKINEHFAGIRSKTTTNFDRGHDSGLTGEGAEIRNLAAGVLKKPSLTECGDLAELASKIGEMKTADEKMALAEDWGAHYFSEEEIKYAIQDAYHCYHMGMMLLGSL